MRQILAAMKSRFHPLYHLRKVSVFRRLTAGTSITISRRFRGATVYCDLFKDASFVLIPEAPEYGSLVNVARRLNAKRFWDIGANIGAYSWVFLSEVPDGSVVLFEPDTRNGELITKTIARNKFNATHFAGAVAAAAGVADFYADKYTGATGSLVKRADGYGFVERHFGESPTTTQVSVTTIDEQANRLSAPDIIKLNVMGSEQAVIEGGMKTIRQAKPTIFLLEYHVGEGGLDRLLRSLGYSFYDADSFAPVDKLIYNNIVVHRDRQASFAGRAGGIH